MTAALDLAWWALAVLEALGAVWVVVLACGYLRLRRLVRDLRRDQAFRDSDHTSSH